jgi:chromosome segregation protein
MDTAPAPVPRAPAPTDTLASRVGGPIDLAPLLEGVYVASSLTEARALCERLPPAACVVLPDGTLVGPSWVQLPPPDDDAQGILARERLIAELTARLELDEAETQNLRRQLESAHARIAEMERDEHAASEELERLDREATALRDELARLNAEFERRQARAADVGAELERIAMQASTRDDTVAALRQECTEAAAALAAHAARRDDLAAGRSAIQGELDRARQAWREAREQAHQLELGLEQLRTRHAALMDGIARNALAEEAARRRCADIEQALAAARAPRGDLRAALERGLSERLAAENRLAEARTGLAAIDERMQRSAAQRAEAEQAIAAAQQQLEQSRLEHRALEVRLQELASRFEQTSEDLQSTVAALGEGDSEAAMQEELERIAARIARLGPINLAAIDEYTQLSERKGYLDRQHADLAEALATLQEAIRKIDRETRTRFRETFEKVNNGLQAMFPVLFGGGHAYLEMTGEDLLETGVTVMARPPGKRNSSIHLLSGGEKALTALAFVFAIFELNPAPFCLLDEVDAPLDDNNVVRLTEMLRSMSKQVQFLFVTHNKITMEIAELLIGVTMQEAGVSRLVTVNMEEAVELAATA